MKLEEVITVSDIHMINNEVVDNCPFCNTEHLIKVKEKKAKAIIKNLEVEYTETYYYCPIKNSEFIPDKMAEENMLKAKDKYKKIMGLLTSDEIKHIREVYELTQKEFSNIFGWGDVTVQRYEKKLIQDETYDDMMRITLTNPSYTLTLLEKHKDRFDEKRFIKIKNVIKELIKKKGNVHLKIEEIKNMYIDFDEPSDLNGKVLLDIEKIKSLIGYFVHYMAPLTKIKLMNLLWYSDMLSHKLYGKSITGLVYEHVTLGACPIAFNEIINLPCIKVEEEFEGELISFKVYLNEQVNILNLSLEELNVIEKVALFFKEFSTKDVIDYIYEEKPYIETEKENIIPYFLSNTIKEFI